MYNFVDGLQIALNKRAAVPATFRFFESHFDKDLGSAGPLVYFLEEENDYISELKQSISKKSTDLTVWMVNRILDGSGAGER